MQNSTECLNCVVLIDIHHRSLKHICPATLLNASSYGSFDHTWLVSPARRALIVMAFPLLFVLCHDTAAVVAIGTVAKPNILVTVPTGTKVKFLLTPTASI
jgi:hypothetical protein